MDINKDIMENRYELESKVINIIKNILIKEGDILKDVGLQAKLEGPKRYNNESGYSSEIEISFWDGNKFEDILEFFVFLDDQQDATITEIESWFIDNLNDVIKKRKTKKV